MYGTPYNYNPFGPHAPTTTDFPDVPQARLSAAERAGATHLSGDGRFAYCTRYGRVYEAEYDGAAFGSWFPGGQEMPAGAVVL